MKEQQHSRRTERILLLFVTVICVALALQFYNNIKKELKTTNQGYLAGTVVNLTAPLQTNQVKKILAEGGYFTDATYINFIAKNLTDIIALNGSLPNLGSLNKTDGMVDALRFNNSGSESGKLRFINSLAHIGMDSALYRQEKTNPQPYPSHVAVQKENTGIVMKGRVSIEEKQVAPKGILVKLSEIITDDELDKIAANDQAITTEFFARTDEDGHFEFSNLKKGGNYSVLPIRPGFEFGASKGKAQIKNSITLPFVGKPHQLRLLDITEYRQIKNDKVFTVRTPKNFENTFLSHLLLFLISFWGFHLVLSLKKFRSDQFLLPLIMLLSGISTLTLFSIQDPLRDEILGAETALYVSLVLLAFSVLLFFFRSNPVNRFYNSHWFDPVHRWLPWGNPLKAPRGYSWLIASIAVMLLLALFGTGPEGSGVKVNLLGFQVSELSKILMTVFFAAYFTANTEYFKNIPDNRWLTQNNLRMLVLFVFLLGIYAVLGDLGPAIVLCLTFLFFYSFAKEEFFQMILVALGYAILLLVVSHFNKHANFALLPWTALVVCVASFLVAVFQKKHESVFFIVLIISSFILLAALPFEFTQRLHDRNGMFANIWENQLSGGDQVAQGVWALNSGGWLGQGLTKGRPNLMPAYPTDMILQSISEEMGILVLLAIFVVFGLLVYRSLLAARRTGKTFLFYLISGIAITTLLQMMLIVAGTLGLIPLTGVSVPFLSKGNAGNIITVTAFCFVILMSHEKGDKLEMEYVRKNFDNVNAYAILFFFGMLLLFSGTLFWYQFHSDKYIVKPALVLNRQGAWQLSYNPRIGTTLRNIKAGNIYDRNGILLATSEKELLQTQKNKLTGAGVSVATIEQQLKTHKKRYYPFMSDLLFWLSDANKEIAREPYNGYAAEYRHYTMLRGFHVNSTAFQKTSDRFRENRFVPPTEKESDLVWYDYSALAPLIKAGENSSVFKKHQSANKDIFLSIDVVLNQKINALIQNQTDFKNFRTSVVAINAQTGEVLASAINPSPSYKDLKLISNIDPLDYRSIFKQIFGDRMLVPQDLGITLNSRPGSTVKIIDAYAALNQYGLPAANFSYFVEPGEVIRQGEPVNETVDMHKAIVRSSNVYFIKLANDKKLQPSLLAMYDVLGMNLINRGGFHFHRPENYNSSLYLTKWNQFLSKGKDIFTNKKLIGSRKRFASRYSDIAWGQGELGATPLHLAKMAGILANKGILNDSRFLFKTWDTAADLKTASLKIAKTEGMNTLLASYMKEQSASVAAATQLQVYGKTGSPERDKLIRKGNTIIRKRVTDAWYTFFVHSPKLDAPLAFTIRIEEIGNSDHAKKLAILLLNDLKKTGYF